MAAHQSRISTLLASPTTGPGYVDRQTFVRKTSVRRRAGIPRRHQSVRASELPVTVAKAAVTTAEAGAEAAVTTAEATVRGSEAAAGPAAPRRQRRRCQNPRNKRGH